MQKAFALLFLIFLVLVMLNYFLGEMQNVLNSSTIALNPNTSNNSLSYVDFSLFGKDGIGRDYITQGYGKTSYSYVYRSGWHDGIDISAQYGAPLYSASDGTVLATGNQDSYCYHRGFGKYVAVKDDLNNLVLWYAHLGTISVSPGGIIKKKSLIGAVGATGFETGPHLHFSIFEAKNFSMENKNGCGPDPLGKDLNPLLYLGTTY